MFNLRFAPQGFPVQRFHPALEGRISEEAATPGHQFTGHEPDFPRRFTLEESPATLNRTGRASDTRALTAEYLAGIGDGTQEQNCTEVVKKLWRGRGLLWKEMEKWGGSGRWAVRTND